jgi:hypothetical protein
LPDFSKCTVVWGGGHGLSRSIERFVTPEDAERLIHESTEHNQGKKGRWIIWGCVRGRRTKVVVRELKDGLCIVVTVIRTGKPCS